MTEEEGIEEEGTVAGAVGVTAFGMTLGAGAILACGIVLGAGIVFAVGLVNVGVTEVSWAALSKLFELINVKSNGRTFTNFIEFKPFNKSHAKWYAFLADSY